MTSIADASVLLPLLVEGLAALALSLDYEMTTFGRGFESFRGLRVRLLT